LLYDLPIRSEEFPLHEEEVDAHSVGWLPNVWRQIHQEGNDQALPFMRDQASRPHSHRLLKGLLMPWLRRAV
jgi:hypothetical protein